MLKLYNTLSRRKEVFVPLNGKNIGMYTCGPTVYNYVHIGNLRAYITSDIIKKYLKFIGYKVKHVMNLTDVDDKTIRKSQEENKQLNEVTTKYSKAFFEDIKTLGIEPADFYPKATEHISEIVKMINSLLKKEIAYISKDGSIYFNIAKFKSYGKLSHANIKALREGASERVKKDEYEKEQVNDFALWKSWDENDGNVFWNEYFLIDGKKQTIKGRPGWHIECSAMSMKYLGESFDIHAGGQDLIFPHHENEIAQSEAATGKQFVKYWVHNGWLLVNGKKMSKSLGNFYTLKDLINKGYSPEAIRYSLLTTHYREPFDMNENKLNSAKNSLSRIHGFVEKLKSYSAKEANEISEKAIDKLKEEFKASMDNDFDTPNALIKLFDFIRQFNPMIDSRTVSNKTAKYLLNTLEEIDAVLGFIIPKEINMSKEMKVMIEEREKARKAKQFRKSDEIRDKLAEMGYKIDDTAEGPMLKKI